MRYWALTIILACTVANLVGADLKLTSKGEALAIIGMDSKPSGPEFQAAKELQNYIKKISGASIDRVTAPAIDFRIRYNKPDLIEILLVTLEDGRHLLPNAVQEKLSAGNDDAFYIKTEGKRILIAGKKPIGVLYGTYTFIEKYLGVCWFHPGNDGEYCPKTADITVGNIDDFEQPDFTGRIISTWEMSVKPWKLDEVKLWEARNKVQFLSRYIPNRSRQELDFFACGNRTYHFGGHMAFEQAVPARLFSAHPEYFPMIKGKRVCVRRAQRCLANPEVKNMLVDYICKVTAYGFGFMITYDDIPFENDAWCKCPECLKMGTYKGKFSVSNLAHSFTSEVAKEVLKRNPDADLAVEIYSSFRDLPTDPSITYDPRVLGRYAPHQRCYVHKFDDKASDCNSRFYKQLEAWQKLCPKIEIFDFYSYSRSPYAPMEYVLAHDLKVYKKLKVQQWWEDCTNKELPVLSSNWPFYYVASKMLWDVSLDAEVLLNKAYDKYYGAAREPMKKYQAMRRRLWEEAPGHALYGGPTRIGYCLTVPQAGQRLKSYLDEADKLAVNDTVLKRRIAMDRQYLEKFWVKEAAKIQKSLTGQNTVPVRERTSKIKIDGSLDEDDWRYAQLVTGFMTSEENNSPGEPAEDTRVKVLYDQDNWYISIEAMTEHAWSPLKSEVHEHDGNVWKDDSVEFFIMPPSSDYYHWVINSAGVFYDAKMRQKSFESGAEIKSRVLKDRYVIEARIPVKSMGTQIKKGQVWNMHFGRTCRNLQPPKSIEDSALDGVPAHEQTLFRRVPIGNNIIRNGNFAEIVKNKKTGVFFPKGWGGNKATLVRGENNRNYVKVKDRLFIFVYLGQPAAKDTNLISGTLVASGKGTMTVSMQTCIKTPDPLKAKKPWKADHKYENPSFQLTPEPKPHHFEFQFAPYEEGDISFKVNGGEAVIYSINAAALPVSSKQ